MDSRRLVGVIGSGQEDQVFNALAEETGALIAGTPKEAVAWVLNALNVTPREAAGKVK